MNRRMSGIEGARLLCPTGTSARGGSGLGRDSNPRLDLEWSGPVVLYCGPFCDNQGRLVRSQTFTGDAVPSGYGYTGEISLHAVDSNLCPVFPPLVTKPFLPDGRVYGDALGICRPASSLLRHRPDDWANAQLSRGSIPIGQPPGRRARKHVSVLSGNAGNALVYVWDFADPDVPRLTIQRWCLQCGALLGCRGRRVPARAFERRRRFLGTDQRTL